VAAAVLILGLIAGSYEIVRRGVVSDGATRAFALLGSVARQAGHVVRAESAPPVEPVMLDDEVPAFARDAAQTGIPARALFLEAPAPRSHRWGGWAFLTNLLTIGPRDLWAGYTPAPGAMPMCQAAPRHP
jgi:hypothetical protein